MKQLFIFIGGFITGMIFLFLVLYIISIRSDYSEKEILRKNVVYELTKSFDKGVQIQYIEVKGKKGIVTLHTGMSKDSVQILVGKPDEISLNTIVNSTYESWGYKINNKYGTPKEYQISDLTIDFVDGKLGGVRQD